MPAISSIVRFARNAHHHAMWATTMAERFPEARRFYRDMAKRNRAAARSFMAQARRVKIAA